MEIGGGGTEIRRLRGRLGLDSAYVSRLLRSLERQRLVAVKGTADDGRARRVRLTKAGRAERATLDHLADGFARSLLLPLSDGQRTRLTSAMAEVERLLLASMVTIRVADPSSAAARWCFEQYFAELDARFDRGFDPARSTTVAAHDLIPPSGLLLIAWLRHEPVGCGALKRHGRAPAEIKRMWLAPPTRGLGVGHRLLAELENQAREAGASGVQLETNRALTEAIALYRRSGYREVPAFNDEPYAHHWFEKRLQGRERATPPGRRVSRPGSKEGPGPSPTPRAGFPTRR